MITIRQNHPLRDYNTFALESSARLFVETMDSNDLIKVLNTNNFNQNRILILGGGSNIVFTSQQIDTVIHPVNKSIRVVEESRDSVLVCSGAGTLWDDLVSWSVQNGLGGLENLSLIPGSVGAAPIQNIGAYGAEAGMCVESVGVIDLLSGRQFRLSNQECRFGYRYSTFKNPLHKTWLVWEVFFLLEKDPRINLSYRPLKNEFPDGHKPDIAEIRNAVIRIRQSRLPDPSDLGNAGSFFKNPVVSACHAALLRESFPNMPTFYHDPGTVKIPAGWLIDQCGWKGYRKGQVGVYPEQALVLVNYGNATAGEVMDLAGLISDSVKKAFGISLEPEVQLV
jgi:UDP-N-acetylmuramate dehydrogenase